MKHAIKHTSGAGVWAPQTIALTFLLLTTIYAARAVYANQIYTQGLICEDGNQLGGYLVRAVAYDPLQQEYRTGLEWFISARSQGSIEWQPWRLRP